MVLPLLYPLLSLSCKLLSQFTSFLAVGYYHFPWLNHTDYPLKQRLSLKKFTSDHIGYCLIIHCSQSLPASGMKTTLPPLCSSIFSPLLSRIQPYRLSIFLQSCASSRFSFPVFDAFYPFYLPHPLDFGSRAIISFEELFIPSELDQPQLHSFHHS